MWIRIRHTDWCGGEENLKETYGKVDVTQLSGTARDPQEAGLHAHLKNKHIVEVPNTNQISRSKWLFSTVEARVRFQARTCQCRDL
jgi:hypothetical protein